MSSLKVTDTPFTKAHESSAAILKKQTKRIPAAILLFWFGMLLSLGDNVEIIQPRNIRERVIDAMLQLNKNGGIHL